MSKKIIIVGAGVAGLIAARHCEEKGYQPLILEASERAGGRVKTDQVDGFLLDRGFQVLLTEYAEVQRYLDLSQLNLRYFEPGAAIYADGRAFRFRDPLRDPTQLWSALFSPVGTLLDKIKIWQLHRSLQGMSREKIFDGNAQSTLDFLRAYGFSEKIIERFFRPFFGGIFLENDLSTPATMFRFVFKMFGKGFAAIPAQGMEAVVKQLQSRLTQTSFRFNTTVQEIQENFLLTNTGERLEFDQVIVATNPATLIAGLSGQNQAYQGTYNLYFAANFSPLPTPLIALVADAANPINSFCVLSDVSAEYAPAGQHLLSVSLKADTMATPETVIAALKKLTQRDDLELRHLRTYHIPDALPIIDELRYTIPGTQYRLNNNVVLAGDWMLNASLDAAMRSGRDAMETL